MAIIGTPSSPATITFQQAAFEALKILDGVGPDGFLQGVATSGSSQVQLEDLATLKSSLADASLHADKYIWRPFASYPGDQAAAVAAYTPNLGVVEPDTTPWTMAPYSGGLGETWCFSKTLAPAQLYDCANRALRHMFINSEITFQPNSDPLVRRYNLTSLYAWVTEEWQVRQLGFLNANMPRDDYEPIPVRGTKQKYDGTVYVRVPGGHPTTDTFYVKVLRPLYTNVNLSGQQGFVSAADTTQATLDWLAWGIVTFAWDEYSEFFSTREDMARLQEAVKKAASRFQAERERRFTALADMFEHSELLNLRYAHPYLPTDDGGLAARK